MEIRWYRLEDLSERRKLEAEARLRSLGGEQRDVIDVHITAQDTRHHRHGAKQVHIACKSRGRDVVAAREASTLELALDEALDAFERDLRKLRERRRQRPEGGSLPPYLGIIERLRGDEDYGFILTDDGERVYFHRNALHGGLEFPTLVEGARVALQIVPGEKGPQASAVVPARPDTPSP